MENKYVALRIYSNYEWCIILLRFEALGYHWASGDKPTSSYGDTDAGVMFINPVNKTLVFNKNISATSLYCDYYINVVQ